MDEALLSWCDATLSSVKKQMPAGKASSDSTSETISVVEAAAFLRMTELRGIPFDAALERCGPPALSNVPSLKSSVATCPLTRTTPPEVLGSIHEYCAGQSGLPRAPSASRRSRPRKVGGIFYTPQHVIDYIVDQTLSRRLERMEPDQVASLKVLDPAVGCAAFLLTAYRSLMVWHWNWFTAHEPDQWPDDLAMTRQGWRLTFRRRRDILLNNLFGVDLDGGAIEVAQRTLWLELIDGSDESPVCEFGDVDWTQLSSNLKQGHSLVGPAFREFDAGSNSAPSTRGFSWEQQFPKVAASGGFDLVIGNPPYRRERNFKRELDEIGNSPLGRYRAPRMDLWYYFVHRGIDLLRDGGTLSYITNAYWLQGTGAEKLIETLRDTVHLDELFLLRDQPLFPGVFGQHSIMRLTKCSSNEPTTIKVVPPDAALSPETFAIGTASVRQYSKSQGSLFSGTRLDVLPAADELLAKLSRWPQLKELGIVRQGIAENPSTINRRTIERFSDAAGAREWVLGEGVFSLQPHEVHLLDLSPHESELLRPYHDLCDLGRYWSATKPSRQLIYSTRTTCPVIDDCPSLHRHLGRFQVILDARRETKTGSNCWWHLHWPRDERLWRSSKLIALQMATRPSLVPTFGPTYVPFSAHVFVPAAETREDLRYLSGLLNSRILWAWFEHHAKRRGVGLELNGHVLEKAPIRRIDFNDPEDVQFHDKLTRLVDRRIQLQQLHVEQRSDISRIELSDVSNEIETIESEIDYLVSTLYRLDLVDVDLANEITQAPSKNARSPIALGQSGCWSGGGPGRSAAKQIR